MKTTIPCENTKAIDRHSEAIASLAATLAAGVAKVEAKADKTALAAEVERAQKAEEQLTDKISELETTKANKATTLAGYGITDAATKEEVEEKSDKTALESEIARAQEAEAQLTNKISSLYSVKADKANTLAGYGITNAATKEEVAVKADKTVLEAEVARAQAAEAQLTNKVNELDSDKAERITYENAGEINTSVTLKNNVIRRVEITDADVNLDVIFPENDKSYRNYCEMLLVVAENATSVNLITPPNTNVYSAAEDSLVPEVGMNHIIFLQVGDYEWVASRTMLSNIVGGGTVVLEKSSSTTLMNNYELGDDNVVGDLADKTGHSVEDDTSYGTYIENL